MDQLKYSLRSVEMYIPWARHVYIVTNGQGMDFVAENIFGVTGKNGDIFINGFRNFL